MAGNYLYPATAGDARPSHTQDIPGPNIFYPLHSAHLSQSDFGILFPWATVFAADGYGAATLVEMFLFLGFLAVGLLYAWKKGVLA